MVDKVESLGAAFVAEWRLLGEPQLLPGAATDALRIRTEILQTAFDSVLTSVESARCLRTRHLLNY